MKLNFVQDLASPHNNVLIQAMENEKSFEYDLWYCQQSSDKYNWKNDLRHAIKKAHEYQPKKFDWQFIKECLFSNDKLLMVGWANTNTRLVVLLAWLLRKKFNMWFDFPQDTAERSGVKGLLREAFYWFLKTSKARVFCVGEITVDYFKKRGFSEDRLVNLPIFIEVDDHTKFQKRREEMRTKYGVKEGELFITSGSRLVWDKGYDILIDAIAALPEDVKNNVKCVIVGQGEVEEDLKQQIKDLNLEGNVKMEAWLEIDDFRALLASSDVFAHPCRFDAFGGTIYAMSLGVPVIGSTGAGAAVDRVKHGENGYMFENENIQEFADRIVTMYNEQNKLPEFSKKARATAESWKPAQGVKILEENLI